MIEKLNPTNLNEILISSQVLREGRVTGVSPLRTYSPGSITSYKVTYSADATPNAPVSLILKLSHNYREAKLYELASSSTSLKAIIAPCYAYGSSSTGSYVLLKDLSATHQPISLAEERTLSEVELRYQIIKMCKTLAQFHAFWWEHPQLDVLLQTLSLNGLENDQSVREYQARLAEQYETFSSCVHNFPQYMDDIFRRLLTNFTAIWETYFKKRLMTLSGVTLIHGDSHPSNFLSSKLAVGKPVVIDFENLSVFFGAFDLVYLFTFCPPRLKTADYIKLLINEYHRELLKQGLCNFRLSELVNDFRLMITVLIFLPIIQQTYGVEKEYWWPRLVRLLDAYQELECDALIHQTL